MKITRAFSPKTKTTVPAQHEQNAVATKEKNVTLDYPQENENIVSREYVFRVTGEGAMQSVSVSVDAGNWQPCREAVGHWWYDWSDYKDGEHQVRVEARTQSGAKISFGPRVFRVTFEDMKHI
mgnify:CR=1 FL=1